MRGHRSVVIAVVVLLAFFALASLFTLTVPTLAQAAPQAANPRHVAPDGVNNNNDCTEPLTPCATIQYAVSVALPGDEIRVAGGVYTDVQQTAGITQVVYISRSVTIRGGYSPTFTYPAQPAMYTTTLDALGLGRVVVISGAVTVTLENLSLTGGTAMTTSVNQGGGLFATQATLILSHTTLLRNQAEFGGGMFARQVTGTLVNSLVQENLADYGGGLYWQEGTLTMTQDALVANEVQNSGGGLRLYNSTAWIGNSVLTENRSTLSGGGLYASLSGVTLTNNLINGNVVSGTNQGWGGGLHLHSSSAYLAGNQVLQNMAPVGGGARFLGGTAILMNNFAQDNQAETGGGLSLEGMGVVTITNQVLLSNTAVSGAAIQMSDATAYWQHTTLANNAGNNAVIVNANATAFFTNTLFYNHTAGVQNNSGQVQMAGTLWDATLIPVVGAVTESQVVYGAAALAADGYHLTPASLAIEAGVPDTTITNDIDGEQRPFYNHPDLGADEYTGLIVHKQGTPDTITPGQIVTYTIALTNATGITRVVSLTDVLPTQITYMGSLTASSGMAGYGDGVITWTGTLLPDSDAHLQWLIQVDADILPGTTIRNTATISESGRSYASNTALLLYPAYVYMPVVRTNDLVDGNE